MGAHRQEREATVSQVLLADGDVARRGVLRAALEGAGLTVAEFGEGAPALRAALEQPPELVVVDETLPGTGGAYLCEELRQHWSTRNVPVLVATDDDDDEAVVRALAMGASDVIQLPCAPSVLVNRVGAWVDVAGHRARLARTLSQLANLRRIAGIATWEQALPHGEFDASDEVRSLFELGNERVLFNQLLARLHEQDRSALVAQMRKSAESGEGFSLETRMQVPGRTRDGQSQGRVLHWQAEVSCDEQGRPRRIAGLIQDVTLRRRAEEQIRYLAYHDGLTGLTNRNAFLERLKEAVSSARRHGRMVALLFLDLDNFKTINDTLGHSAGDELLQRVAERLSSCLREEDAVSVPTHATRQVSRLGGDEFTVLLTEIGSSDDASEVARRIIEVLREPFVIERQELVVGTSIGITVFPMDGTDVDALLRNADAAMYQAKEQGRSTYRFFAPGANEAETRRVRMERKLCRAFENHELHVYYQPQVSLDPRAVVGVEALLRWEDPEFGAVSPSEFVPLAEDAGLIVPIGEWVLRVACLQLKAWRDAGLAGMRMAVNVSPHHFEDERLVDLVAQTLWDTGLEGGALELEITENALMQNRDGVVSVLRELRRLGVSIALDDFGTGYSSLSYLKRFPVNAVKIDRSFVRDIAVDPDDAAITAAIISMARALRLRVVGEGVETEIQREFLRKHGCHELQGYVVSAPVVSDAIPRIVEEVAGSTSS